MEKVAIVILNYLNYQDTIECVESIAVDKYQDKQIIIVDNGSANESGAKLQEKFGDSKDITLLFNKKNEGFARGNNVGIRYAADVLGIQFVLLVNNDTIFKDPEMITKLLNAYEPGVGIIGPRILAADGQEQNPVKHEKIRENAQQAIYYRRKIAMIKYKQSSFYKQLRKLNIFKRCGCTKKLQNKLDIKSLCSLNLVLHGACMLLTRDYFKYYPYLFPETFLYHEENILTILTHKVQLQKKFVHTTYIYHKEDQSSQLSFANAKDIKVGFLLDSIQLAKEIFPLDYEALVKKYFKD